MDGRCRVFAGFHHHGGSLTGERREDCEGRSSLEERLPDIGIAVAPVSKEVALAMFADIFRTNVRASGGSAISSL